MEIEEEVYERTRKFITPIGSLDYKGNDFPYSSVLKNEDALPNMYETGDATFHTGVLLRALAWRFKAILDKNELQKTFEDIFKILMYFRKSQLINDGCLARTWVREEGYHQFFPGEKSGFRSANFFGDCEPDGSMRYIETYFENVKYYVRYDISLDAIISAFSGMYWVYKFGNKTLKDLVKTIAVSQYDFYRKNDWNIKDKYTGKLLRYGRHWRINPVGNILRKIIKYLATDEIESLTKPVDWLLNNLFSRVPLMMNSDQRQFNNYMIMSSLCVLQDMGYDCKNSINNLYRETRGQLHYLNNKISNYYLENDSMVIKDIPTSKHHTMTYKESSKVVPHGVRYRPYNVWEESAFRLGIGFQSADLPQAWWLELYWCYE